MPIFLFCKVDNTCNCPVCSPDTCWPDLHPVSPLYHNRERRRRKKRRRRGREGEKRRGR